MDGATTMVSARDDHEREEQQCNDNALVLAECVVHRVIP